MPVAWASAAYVASVVATIGSERAVDSSVAAVDSSVVAAVVADFVSVATVAEVVIEIEAATLSFDFQNAV